MPTAYTTLLHWGDTEHRFKRWEETVIDWLYVAVSAVWVLDPRLSIPMTITTNNERSDT